MRDPLCIVLWQWLILFIIEWFKKRNLFNFNFFMSHLNLLWSITNKKKVHCCNRTSAYEVRLGSGILTFPDKKMSGYIFIYQSPCSSNGLSMYTVSIFAFLLMLTYSFRSWVDSTVCPLGSALGPSNTLLWNVRFVRDIYYS